MGGFQVSKVKLDISDHIATLILDATPHGEPMGDCALDFICTYVPNEVAAELHRDRVREVA
jgi:hypothetical protein